MICYNCSHEKTRVTNSRDHKKTAQVWRRRFCEKCQHITTTYERISLSDEITVQSRKSITPYNNGILLVDLYETLQSSDPIAAQNAFWLARSIEDELTTLNRSTITTEQIKSVAHGVVSRFNTLAGIQYAAKHHLLDKIKRPRR